MHNHAATNLTHITYKFPIHNQTVPSLPMHNQIVPGAVTNLPYYISCTATIYILMQKQTVTNLACYWYILIHNHAVTNLVPMLHSLRPSSYGPNAHSHTVPNLPHYVLHLHAQSGSYEVPILSYSYILQFLQSDFLHILNFFSCLLWPSRVTIHQGCALS